VLILLNGPPGVGKSTIAQLYADDHPLALNLDIDRIRALLGRWQDHAHEAGLRARALALSMARTHLGAGHDVIVPQYLGRATFVEQLEELARDQDVRFRELVLLDSKANLLRRFAERTGASADPGHADAAAQLGENPEARLGEMYDRLMTIIDQRPKAQIIPCEQEHPRLTYQRVTAAL